MSNVIENGVYYIVNSGSGTAMDLNHGDPAAGTPVQGYSKRELDDHRAPAQLWLIVHLGGSGDSSSYTIENAKSGTFMELKGGNISADGTRITCSSKDNSSNQTWRIIRTHTGNGYVLINQASNTCADLYNGDSSDHAHVNGWHNYGPGGSGADTVNPHQLWHIIRA